MKKYVKPELFYERYELSQHIADCAWEYNRLYAQNACPAVADQQKLPNFQNLFTSALGCHYKTDATDGTGSGYQNYCYEDGADGIRVFAS